MVLDSWEESNVFDLRPVFTNLAHHEIYDTNDKTEGGDVLHFNDIGINLLGLLF